MQSLFALEILTDELNEEYYGYSGESLVYDWYMFNSQKNILIVGNIYLLKLI